MNEINQNPEKKTGAITTFFTNLFSSFSQKQKQKQKIEEKKEKLLPKVKASVTPDGEVYEGNEYIANRKTWKNSDLENNKNISPTSSDEKENISDIDDSESKFKPKPVPVEESVTEAENTALLSSEEIKEPIESIQKDSLHTEPEILHDPPPREKITESEKQNDEEKGDTANIVMSSSYFNLKNLLFKKTEDPEELENEKDRITLMWENLTEDEKDKFKKEEIKVCEKMNPQSKKIEHFKTLIPQENFFASFSEKLKEIPRISKKGIINFLGAITFIIIGILLYYWISNGTIARRWQSIVAYWYWWTFGIGITLGSVAGFMYFKKVRNLSPEDILKENLDTNLRENLDTNLRRKSKGKNSESFSGTVLLYAIIASVLLLFSISKGIVWIIGKMKSNPLHWASFPLLLLIGGILFVVSVIIWIVRKWKDENRNGGRKDLWPTALANASLVLVLLAAAGIYYAASTNHLSPALEKVVETVNDSALQKIQFNIEKRDALMSQKDSAHKVIEALQQQHAEKMDSVKREVGKQIALALNKKDTALRIVQDSAKSVTAIYLNKISALQIDSIYKRDTINQLKKQVELITKQRNDKMLIDPTEGKILIAILICFLILGSIALFATKDSKFTKKIAGAVTVVFIGICVFGAIYFFTHQTGKEVDVTKNNQYTDLKKRDQLKQDSNRAVQKKLVGKSAKGQKVQSPKMKQEHASKKAKNEAPKSTRDSAKIQNPPVTRVKKEKIKSNVKKGAPKASFSKKGSQSLSKGTRVPSKKAVAIVRPKDKKIPSKEVKSHVTTSWQEQAQEYRGAVNSRPIESAAPKVPLRKKYRPVLNKVTIDGKVIYTRH